MTEERVECDVLVIGGGPAGIAAAVRAAESGANVVVVDEGSGLGGQIWRQHLDAPADADASVWIGRLVAGGVRVFASTSIVELELMPASTFSALAQTTHGAFEIAARAGGLATGARERFLPFPGWTLPNVFGVGAGQALIKTGMSVAGKRVVIAGTGPLMLPVAASFARSGAELLLVAEQAPRDRVRRFAAGLWKQPRTLWQAAQLRRGFRRTEYAMGTWVVAARGDDAVRSVNVTDGVRERSLDCDILCTAFGLVPSTELARFVGCTVRNSAVVVDQHQGTTVPGVYCAGEPTGVGGVALSLVEGEIAGVRAAGELVGERLVARRAALRRTARDIDEAFALRMELGSLAAPDTIVCRCEDVRLRDLERAWTPRQAKLYTRVGMGPCQGRICGTALECVMGWSADSVRPPVQPARVETFLARSSGRSPTDFGVS
jgi:NADPH-dependent 2,4-dienoyl-CoA reductase/sulfur reductase-like enzyme